MTEERKLIESIKFVASNYDDSYFSTSRAWRKVMPPVALRNIRRIAAASAIAIVITASAFIYHASKYSVDSDAVTNETQENATIPAEEKEISRRIEFNDAALKDVIKKVEEVYQVEIVNIPESNMHLTLSYEGTAEELIDVINEIAGTEMEVKR